MTGKDVAFTRELAADPRTCGLRRPQPAEHAPQQQRGSQTRWVSDSKCSHRGGCGSMAVTKLIRNSEETRAHFSLLRGNDGNLDERNKKRSTVF